jgi:4-amino-4-deoxy-L-arabinose transferase-like glycosyltransferase
MGPASLETGTQGTGQPVQRAMPPTPVYLFTIVLVYLAIGVQYAALTPRWQVPDEPAHFNYIAYLVEKKSLPTLDPGEYDQGYLSWLTSARFPPHLPVGSLQYESWQPPLYYLLAAPIYLISNGGLLPLRLFSLALGTGVIVFAFLTVQALFPEQPVLAATAAGFIAFIPQHIAMMAGVNNDSLSELVIAFGLWRIVRLTLHEAGRWDAPILGATLAAAFVTKSQAYVLAPLTGLMLLFQWRREGRPAWRTVARRALVIFAPALLIGALWWGRNLAVYGWPDIMSSIRHDQVVKDQPRTRQWIESYGTAEVLRRFGQTTFQSFWGQFGWMGVVMDGRVYLALGMYSALIALGAVAAAPAHVHRGGTGDGRRWAALGLLLISGLLTLGLYLFYNLTYVQHQGRYLFPALVPIGLAAAAGLGWWGEKVEAVTRRRIGWVVSAGGLAAMGLLAMAALYRFIIPAL